MGNIDLQHELLLINKKFGIIDRRSGRECNCVRRVYSAKIDGRNTDLTLAMYEGDGAEEAWQQHVKMYMSLRHPNIVQMYGTARSGAMFTNGGLRLDTNPTIRGLSFTDHDCVHLCMPCGRMEEYLRLYETTVAGLRQELQREVEDVLHIVDTSFKWPALCRSSPSSGWQG
ncbi:hypothetical protein C8F04DRAFT_277332 [Mycena alexandri]|uniref:Protein kinase domain-containing protein n=1 Tax=Mycena alexandri TaxID=1745969 RepID=A0AAD6S5B2_9AGAR|nr:hypothetical protein C8F04DRAFT_277332 [Mycena alexandri]